MKTKTVLSVWKIFLVFIFAFFWFNFGFAATATFTGSVVDDGGDPNLIVWFEYGKTSSLGQKTAEQSQYGIGDFSISVSGLDNCSTYYYRAAIRHRDFNDTSYGQIKTFSTPCDTVSLAPSVDLKINNSDGPVYLQANSSAILTWTANNVNYCFASGDWSGAKTTSGSENTGLLTSSKVYTLTCSGNYGTVSDTVYANINLTTLDTEVFSIEKQVRNLSDGTVFANSTIANPGEILEFKIKITALKNATNITLIDTLPQNINWRENTLKIDGVQINGDIVSGINLGNLLQNQTKTITFWADIKGKDYFKYGNTVLINSVLINANEGSSSGQATIVVQKEESSLAPTQVSTGFKDTILNSILLPVLASLILTWLFAGHIINFEAWIEKRKKSYENFKAKKILNLKIKKLKKIC